MIVPMTKVHLIGHRRSLDATLSCLHDLGLVHLVDVTEDRTVLLPPMAVGEARLRETEQLRYLRTRLAALLALAPAPLPGPAGAEEAGIAGLDDIRAGLDAAAPEIEAAVRRLDELTTEKDTFPRYLDSLRRLLPLVPELTTLRGYGTMALVLDARHAAVLGDLNVALTELLGGNFEMISDKVDVDTIGAVLVFPRRAHADVDALVGREQVSRLRLPARFENVPFGEAVAGMEERLAHLDDDIDVARSRIADLVVAHPEWRPVMNALDARLDELGAIRHVGATPHTFAVSGWVPTPRLDELRNAFAGRLGDDVVLEEASPGPDDEPPVLMDNAGPARSFQSLVRLLAVPRYGTLDPSRLMSIFLPLFFGMMLGDVGYGVLLLAGALALTRARRGRPGMVGDLGRVFILSASWTIVWGVVYGELFGDLGHRLFGWEPLWINREEALTPLLTFSLAVGGAHVLLGLVLGVWQARRWGNRHEMAKSAGTLVALVGLFLAAGTIVGVLPSGAATPGVAALLVGLVVLMAIEGPMGVLLGPLTLMEALGNILSYLRIAAIGLASVYLARVANELGAAMPLWFGILVAVLFHALNLVLGAFSPTIQALRLHYVEFFGKFHETGGTDFAPFGRANRPR